MSKRNFRQMIEEQWSRGNFVCVGLDSEFAKIPEHIRKEHGEVGRGREEAQFQFNGSIVDATFDVVCAYKLNSAFYEADGAAGLNVMRNTIAYIRDTAPHVPVILDAKRADIGNTNTGYATAAFEYLQADALTVHPYLGSEALAPFLNHKDKGIIVLCRTSNPGAGEFQDLLVDGEPLYRVVARRVANHWNVHGNCALVVGATFPDELREVRELVSDMPILIPGIGAQGGDVEKTVSAGKDSRGYGMVINSSRGIIFASSGEDFAEVARSETEKLRSLINQCRGF